MVIHDPCIVYIFFSCTCHDTNKPTCMYTFLLLRTWTLWEIPCLPKESRRNDDWKTYNCMSEAGVSFSGVSLFKCCVLRGSGYLGYVDSNQGEKTSISGFYVP